MLLVAVDGFVAAPVALIECGCSGGIGVAVSAVRQGLALPGLWLPHLFLVVLQHPRLVRCGRG